MIYLTILKRNNFWSHSKEKRNKKKVEQAHYFEEKTNPSKEYETKQTNNTQHKQINETKIIMKCTCSAEICVIRELGFHSSFQYTHSVVKSMES